MKFMGMEVLVPIVAKKKNDENEVILDNNQEQPEKYLQFFKLGNVFDIKASSLFFEVHLE